MMANNLLTKDEVEEMFAPITSLMVKEWKRLWSMTKSELLAQDSVKAAISDGFITPKDTKRRIINTLFTPMHCLV